MEKQKTQEVKLVVNFTVQQFFTVETKAQPQQLGKSTLENLVDCMISKRLEMENENLSNRVKAVYNVEVTADGKKIGKYPDFQLHWQEGMNVVKKINNNEND